MKRILSYLTLLLLACLLTGCGGEKQREAKRLLAVEAAKAEEAAKRLAAEREVHRERQEKILEIEQAFEAQRPTVVSQVVVRLIAPGEMFHERADTLRQKLVSMFDPLFPEVKVIPYDAMSGPVAQFALGVVDVTVQGSWATFGPDASPHQFNGPGCVVKSLAFQVYFPPELPLAPSNGILVVSSTKLPEELTPAQMGSLHPEKLNELESDCLSQLAAKLKPVDKAVLKKKVDGLQALPAPSNEGYAVLFDPLPDSYARNELIAAMEKKLGRGRVFERGYPGKKEIGTVTVNFKQLGSNYKTPGGGDAGTQIPEEAELKLAIKTTGGDPAKDGELVFKAELNAPSTMHFQNMREVAFFQMHALLQELARKMGVE